MDDSGQYPRLRKGLSISGTWVTIIAMGAGLVAAWATNANRLTTAEQAIAKGELERGQMELHISGDDQQIAVIKEQLRFIIEQLQIVNSKLDRAEDERAARK